MISKNISAILLTALIALVLPQPTNAYYTTAQSEAVLTPITAMYTITYSFGLPKQDIYLPIATERNLSHRENDRKLGFSIHDDDEEITNVGRTAGIVLSDAEIRDGMYFVPAGSSKTFTLLVFLRTQDTDQEDDYVVQVDNLPFLVDMGQEELTVRGLNTSELQYYVTGDVSLNENVRVSNIIIGASPLEVSPNGK